MSCFPDPDARVRRRARGFSIVELLVAITIGAGVLAAVSVMLIRHESARRGITATVDAAIGSSHLTYTLDRALRGAGSGFARDWEQTFGCAVHAARDGSAILPRSRPFPAPFEKVSGTYRLAPVLAYPRAGANGSDVLAIAAGHASRVGRGMRVSPSPITPQRIPLKNSLPLRPNELLMVAQQGRHCMVQQIHAGFVPGVSQHATLGGSYATASVGSLSLTDYGLDRAPYVIPLGRPGMTPPTFQLIGIGNDATLFSYDILQLEGDIPPSALESGVVDLRVRYGIDSDGTPGIDRWVAPSEADYLPAALTSGTVAANARLLTIRAVRIGLVLRDSQAERVPVAPATLELFGDLPGAAPVTITLGDKARRQRHRTIEFTVPLRNVLLEPS